MTSEMTRAFITFCTSAKVAPELLNQLNESSYNDGPIEEVFYPLFYNEFTPAERDPKVIPASSKERVEFLVEPFEGFSEIDLQEFFMDKYKAIGEENSSVNLEVFAVLDERSTRDNTIVCFANQHILDEEGEEELYTKWYSWRVAFADAFTMASLLLDASPDFIDGTLIDQYAHFTDDEGVFNVRRARIDGPNLHVLEATRERL